jgi:hypothetical protein
MQTGPKGAHYRPILFRLPEPPPRARNALAADFLSRLPRKVLSEPSERASSLVYYGQASSSSPLFCKVLHKAYLPVGRTLKTPILAPNTRSRKSGGPSFPVAK